MYSFGRRKPNYCQSLHTGVLDLLISSYTPVAGSVVPMNLVLYLVHIVCCEYSGARVCLGSVHSCRLACAGPLKCV